MKNPSFLPLMPIPPSPLFTPKHIPKTSVTSYSNPILASSLIPQSVALGLSNGLSASPSDSKLMLLFLLPLSSLSFFKLLFLLLNRELLLLFKLASSRSEYSGGGLLDLEAENEESLARAEFESRLWDK